MRMSGVTQLESLLHLKDLIVISGSIKNIIARCLGPKCQRTLLTSSTGHTVLTKDGLSILESLHFGHPVARCILDSLRTFSSNYGDGCKTFVIYLHHLLTAIEEECMKQDCDSASLKVKVAKYLHEFLSNDLVSVYATLQDYIHNQLNSVMSQDQISLNTLLQNVVKTYLGGAYSEEIEVHLAGIIIAYLNSTKFTSAEVSLALEWFDNCVNILNLVSDYSNSCVKEGIFLSGIIFMTSVPVTFNTIIMQCPIEGDREDDCGDVLKLSSNYLDSVVTYKTKVVHQFLIGLTKHKVSLILTSHRVPDYILQICSELKINLVCCLEKSDLDFVSFNTKKLPVTSIHDDLTSSNLIAADSYEYAAIGGKEFLKLLLDRSGLIWYPSCLFLCSPLDSLAQQLKEIIRKSLKLVYHCVKESGLNKQEHASPDATTSQNQVRKVLQLNIVAGGGYFEYLLSYHLSCYTSQSLRSPPHRKYCCSILVKMLNAVPQTLHQNCSLNQSVLASNYLTAYTTVKENLANHSIVGFSSEGKVCNPLANGVIEVLSIKIAAVYEVVALVEKLLRLNSIIGVKRLSAIIFTPDNIEDEDG